MYDDKLEKQDLMAGVVFFLIIIVVSIIGVIVWTGSISNTYNAFMGY